MVCTEYIRTRSRDPRRFQGGSSTSSQLPWELRIERKKEKCGELWSQRATPALWRALAARRAARGTASRPSARASRARTRPADGQRPISIATSMKELRTFDKGNFMLQLLRCAEFVHGNTKLGGSTSRRTPRNTSGSSLGNEQLHGYGELYGERTLCGVVYGFLSRLFATLRFQVSGRIGLCGTSTSPSLVERGPWPPAAGRGSRRRPARPGTQSPRRST